MPSGGTARQRGLGVGPEARPARHKVQSASDANPGPARPRQACRTLLLIARPAPPGARRKPVFANKENTNLLTPRTVARRPQRCSTRSSWCRSRPRAGAARPATPRHAPPPPRPFNEISRARLGPPLRAVEQCLRNASAAMPIAAQCARPARRVAVGCTAAPRTLTGPAAPPRPAPAAWSHAPRAPRAAAGTRPPGG